MKSDTINVKSVFQDRRQYRVPFYQRQYVWNREQQWEPLWDDITEKAQSRLDNTQPPVPHFLGAIVLEPQMRDELKGVDMVHVIDGQQRLTTLQYLLTALAIVMREQKLTSYLSIIEGCITNPNPETMKDPDIEAFKLWPTFRDRQSHKDAITAETRVHLQERFKASFTQGGGLRKQSIQHPPALEAIWYFAAQIDEWLADKPDPAAAVQVLTEATLQDLKFVAIILEEQDDPQVIFETLNDRGAKLMPTDLIRNFIFMRADRQNADPANLYDTLWSQFEDSFWGEPQRRGRLTSPRREWFMQSALQAELADEIDIGRLYQSYRQFAERMPLAVDQLRFLSDTADSYRQFINKTGDAPIAWFGTHIDAWDASGLHPVALFIAKSGLPDAAQRSIYADLVSYVVRRAVCGLTNKNYNKIFLQLLKRLGGGELAPERIRLHLSALQGDASRWPTDPEFMAAWLNEPIITRVGEISRVRYILAQLEKALRPERTDDKIMSDLSGLDVDHILPTAWHQHWPVNGSQVTSAEAQAATLADLTMQPLTERQQLINRRSKVINTVGNLTLLHYGVNRSLQNAGFAEKQAKLISQSNLMLNRDPMVATAWDETAIQQRGNKLFEHASGIWLGPATN